MYNFTGGWRVAYRMEEGKEFIKNYRLDQFIAGVTSGGLATCILHPLDLVKTQFQVKTVSKSDLMSKPYLYTFHYLKNIYVRHGLFRGLYQGLSANLAGSTASWGIYFFLYDWTKAGFPKNSHGNISTGNYFLASSAAAIVTVFITNPLWMIKTRLCMQTPGLSSNYHGLIDAFKRISKEEGVTGLYRGLVPGLFGVSHGAVQFMVYEEMKNNFHKAHKILDGKGKESAARKPNTLEYLLMSSTSKTIAMIVTYPYQVVRSRLQIKAEAEEGIFTYRYRGIRDVIGKTFRQEGLWAFYRGIVPSTVRVLPGTCITFLTYETISSYFRNK